MSHGLFIPSADNDPRSAVHLPARFRWPCGDRPYRRTVRAAVYRSYYTRLRLWMWFAVLVPPLLALRLLLGFEIWSLAQRIVADAFAIAALSMVAWWLDHSIFGEIVDGQAHDPTSPCIARASEAAYGWRRAWMRFEAGTAIKPGAPHFDADFFFRLPANSIVSHDLSPLVQGLGLQTFLHLAAETTGALIQSNDGSIARGIHYVHRPAVLLITPITSESRAADIGSSTMHVWMVLSEPDTADPGAVQRIGITYWHAGGKVSDGRTMADDAAITIGYRRIFFNRSLRRTVLTTLLLWPAGLPWLVHEALRERRTHELYSEFCALHNPLFGDSLDLWLIQVARDRLAKAFPRVPDAFTRRARAVASEFKLAFANLGASTSGFRAGDVR